VVAKVEAEETSPTIRRVVFFCGRLHSEAKPVAEAEVDHPNRGAHQYNQD
jgi:hypothetical protein